MARNPSESPNQDIDDAILLLMKKLKSKGDDSVPADTAVKIINAAVAWEKVKHQIKDDVDPFNPDNL